MIASAPGRVNLIGEHTDYNDGFVLPMAIDRRVLVALSPRDDDRIVAYSTRFGERRELSLSGQAPTGSRCWEDYVAGVALALRGASIPGTGADLLISAGVPVGAGLSSSAALEIALSRSFFAVVDHPWDARAAARLAQGAENRYVGVRCGIMDQLTAAAGHAGHALLLDCRSLDISHVALPAELAVVVMDTGVRRSLSASEYNERRESCERAVAALRTRDPAVRALRDVSRGQLDASADLMDARTLRRAQHVVEEMTRPVAMRDALEAGDFARAGTLMNASHSSLRDLYEVSSVHLDMACECARAHPACCGARLTGAGFGGCAIALVHAPQVDRFIAEVQPAYEARSYKRADFYRVSPDDGARLEEWRLQ